jgi:hypothetical protein
MKESVSLSHPRASLAPYATRKESRQYELSQEDEQLFNDDNDELESTDFDKVLRKSLRGEQTLLQILVAFDEGSPKPSR